MVTHDQEEALTMADRIVVMNQGVIEQVGTPLEIYRHPQTAFVADFIGTMNFLPGRVAAPDRVQLGHQALSCEAGGLGQGADVTVAIRPEDILVQGAASDGENALVVYIERMEFLGSFYRASLGSNGIDPDDFRADLSVNLVRRLAVEEGQEIHIQMPRERIRVYPRISANG